MIFLKERTYTSVPDAMHTLQRVRRERNARVRAFLHEPARLRVRRERNARVGAFLHEPAGDRAFLNKPAVIFSPRELTSASSG